jgi:hypothetical protein
MDSKAAHMCSNITCVAHVEDKATTDIKLRLSQTDGGFIRLRGTTKTAGSRH